MDLLLTDREVRVLGALIEKEITTPDYYPLSLNALTNACNQKSNRNPVMALDDGAVREALGSLEKKWLAAPTSTAESRVTKFGHRAQEVFNFDRRETALLCELMLRGPQTPGELRARAERMYRFDDLETLEATLQKLSERQPPLVKKLARLPGTKESRYAQLLAGDKPEWVTAVEPADLVPAPASDDRIPAIEAEVAELKRQLTDLQQQFAQFKKQFE
ncbi:MAG: YceH family protein [Acidobacteriota bacterium]|nr:YceH family protein [Acidobacteriota bacterium]